MSHLATLVTFSCTWVLIFRFVKFSLVGNSEKNDASNSGRKMHSIQESLWTANILPVIRPSFIIGSGE